MAVKQTICKFVFPTVHRKINFLVNLYWEEKNKLILIISEQAALREEEESE